MQMSREQDNKASLGFGGGFSKLYSLYKITAEDHPVPILSQNMVN